MDAMTSTAVEATTRDLRGTLAFSQSRYIAAPGRTFPEIDIRVENNAAHAWLGFIAVTPPKGTHWATDGTSDRRSIRVVDGTARLAGDDALVASRVPGRYGLAVSAAGYRPAVVTLDASVNPIDPVVGGWVWGYEPNSVSGTGTEALRMIDEGHAITPSTLLEHGLLRKFVFTTATSQHPGSIGGFALFTDGTLLGTGGNQTGRAINHDGTVSYDTSARGGAAIIDIVAAAGTCYGLTTDGRVLAWGKGGHGGLGNGATTGATAVGVEVAFPAGTFITQIQAHARSVHGQTAGGGYALDARGCVWAWGYGRDASIGDGAKADRPRPVRVIAGGAREIQGNESSGAALLNDGRVVNWGAADHTSYGGLSARQAAVDRPRLVLTADDTVLTGVESLSGLGVAGRTFGAVLDDGTFWAWGDDHGLRTRRVNAVPEFRATRWALASTLPVGVDVVDWRGYVTTSRVAIMLGSDGLVYSHLNTSSTSSLIRTRSGAPLETSALWGASNGVFAAA